MTSSLILSNDIHALRVFAEQNSIVYSAVGDGSALAFFSINPQTGGVFVKNSLRQDSLVSYTVSSPQATVGPHSIFLSLLDAVLMGSRMVLPQTLLFFFFFFSQMWFAYSLLDI